MREKETLCLRSTMAIVRCQADGASQTKAVFETRPAAAAQEAAYEGFRLDRLLGSGA